MQSALTVSEQHSLDLEQRIAVAKEQHRASQARAREMCRLLQESGPKRLLELLPSPRAEVTARAARESSGQEGPASAGETEAVILETGSSQKAAMLELKELHHRQRCCLVGLGEQLQGPHRNATHEALQELSANAKESLVHGAQDAQTTLGALEASLRQAAEAAAEGAGTLNQEAKEAQQSFADRARELLETLASQRRSLSDSAKRTSAALAKASEAVAELSSLSDSSLQGAAEAVTSLQSAHTEILEKLRDKATRNAEAVKARGRATHDVYEPCCSPSKSAAHTCFSQEPRPRPRQRRARVAEHWSHTSSHLADVWEPLEEKVQYLGQAVEKCHLAGCRRTKNMTARKPTLDSAKRAGRCSRANSRVMLQTSCLPSRPLCRSRTRVLQAQRSCGPDKKCKMNKKNFRLESSSERYSTINHSTVDV